MNHNVRYIGRQLQQVCSLGLAGVIAAGLGLPVLVGAPPAQGGGGETVTGRANLHPIDDSGIKARIAFEDDGATLTVTGKATGLNPGESYITLIYDNGSVPGGPRACQPTIFDPTDPDFLLATMFVAFWAIDPDGNGTLEATNTNGGFDYVPLSKVGNASVRLVTGPPPKGSVIPMTELMACGHVNRRPAVGQQPQRKR